MQSAEAVLSRNSLFLALRRYSSAVKDMEQTVLLPSLLRDVPSDEAWDCGTAEESSNDLYESYLMLKALRNTVESGTLEDPKAKNPVSLLDTDSEALFRFHLRGLFSVMTDLTKKTQSLTEKYMDIIGVVN